MKLKEYMPIISGELHLTAYDRCGKELWYIREKNLIVSGAYQITAEALSGVVAAKISKVAVGTNGTSPVVEDVEITSPTIVEIQAFEYPQPGVVRYNFTVRYNDAVGVSIREFGLLSDDGRLFARKVREPIEKTKYISIVGVWEITV